MILHEENEMSISAKNDPLCITMFAEDILELFIEIEYTYRN